jgi:hypothetical protein
MGIADGSGTNLSLIFSNNDIMADGVSEMLYELHKQRENSCIRGMGGVMGAKTCTAGLIVEGGRRCWNVKGVENQGMATVYN